MVRLTMRGRGGVNPYGQPDHEICGLPKLYSVISVYYVKCRNLHIEIVFDNISNRSCDLRREPSHHTVLPLSANNY